MVSFAFILASIGALASVTVAQSVASNPNTIYLTQTNSEGIITGGPSVYTSQPALPSAVTSLPPVASLPILPDGTTTLVFGDGTYTVAVSGTSTSIITPTPSTSSIPSVVGTTASSSHSKGQAAAATANIAAGVLGGAGAILAVFI